MKPDVTAKLVDAILRPAQGVSTVFGVVTAVSAQPAAVSVSTDGPDTVLTGLRHLASYAPAVGDQVIIVKSGTFWWIAGKLA